MANPNSNDAVIVPGAPDIPGLRFRHWRDDADWPAIAAVRVASVRADDFDGFMTPEEARIWWSKTKRSDPTTDILVAEVGGETVAYSRVSWEEEQDGNLVYRLGLFIRPEYRDGGLVRAMLRQAEGRIRQIAATHATDNERVIYTLRFNNGAWLADALAEFSYHRVRHFYDMVKTDLENIVDKPMPEGIRVRPALPEHYRAIWEADYEAFQDHWNSTTADEESYLRWLERPDFQPELWQVAWDGDQVAGMVRNSINHEENAALGRKRGYTEDISVRRPWRKRGLASALIVRSQRMFRDMGMTEVALNVDGENPTGALQLYRSLGYRTYQTAHTFSKEIVS